jgi:transposase
MRHVFADGGYAGDKLRDAIAGSGQWTIEIIKRSDKAKGFQVLHRRWVVERTFAWLGRCRRLAKDWETTIASSTAWATIASIRMLTRRTARYCYAWDLSSQMGWLPPSPDGIAMCQESGVYSHRAGRTATVMKDTMIGVDLAKNVFQLHAASMTGQLRFSRKLSREKFRSFMAGQPPAVVVMEACGSAHYWAREMVRLGHEVKLIAAQYVRPFVKRQKNDAADAEAIVIAAQRPEMRFVEPKTAEQQSRAILFRARERLVRQRTELINALRACLYEYGHIIPQGAHQIKRVAEILDTPNSDLPALMREECAELLEQIAEQTVRINARTTKIKALAVEADTARRLQTIPGVGPLTALAVEAFAPPMENFKCGRDFAAWLGLVPRQFSSGGKERLGRISKAGQADIRRLLIIGAMSRLNRLGRKSIPETSWLAHIAARKPRMLVAIALANKMARTIWALMTKNEDYRVPAQAAVVA